MRLKGLLEINVYLYVSGAILRLHDAASFTWSIKWWILEILILALDVQIYEEYIWYQRCRENSINSRNV